MTNPCEEPKRDREWWRAEAVRCGTDWSALLLQRLRVLHSVSAVAGHHSRTGSSRRPRNDVSDLRLRSLPESIVLPRVPEGR